MADGSLTLPEETVEGSPALPPPSPEAIRGYTPEKGQIAVVDPDGEVGLVPQENARAALEAGYRPATEAETYGAQTGTAGAIAAGAFGAARGATFGLFDPLTVGLSRLVEGDQGAEDTRHSLALLREAHPTASTVGELGGSLAPLAFGIPGGAPEALAEGGSMLARAGARALAAAPRALGEGVAIGLGQQLSEDTLGNHDLVAQKYVTAGLEGGVLGVLLGAGLHAGLGAIGDKLATRATRAIEAGEAGAVKESSLGTKLSELAEEQAAKGAFPYATISAPELQRLGKTAEEQQARMRQIGRTLLDEGISTPTATKAVQAERLTTRAKEVGEELGAIRARLDESVIRPSAENVIKDLETEVLGPIMAKPFSADAQKVIRPVVEEIADRVGGKSTFESFKELHELRRGLDEKLARMKVWERYNGPAAGHDELKAIRGILEGEYERAADVAAKDLGEDLATKYRVTKALYSDLKTAEKWTTKAAARESQHRAVSLTDTIMAGAGIAVHGPAGLLAPIGNKLMRTFGNQVAAQIADRSAKLLGVQRAAEAYDARKRQAVANFFAGGKKGAKAPPPVKVDPEQVKALRAAVKDPAALTERVSDVVSKTGLHEDAPNIARAMTSVLVRAGVYLNQRMPPAPPPVGFTFGQAKPRPLGPHAQAKLESALGALNVENVFADLDRGRADRMKIEALRIINPDAHADLINELRRYGEDHQAELTHQQEIAVSILTGQPIGAMMQPRTIRGFQKAHVQGTPPDPSQAGVQRQPFGGGGSTGPNRTADTYRAGSDRLEADNA